MVPEHGLQQKNTKQCSAQPSAECFVSSFRQKDEMCEETEKDSTNDEYDQDSSISIENDIESTSSQEEELEDWIEYIKEAREKQYNNTN